MYDREKEIICKYDSCHKELKGSVIGKARAFNRKKCVVPVQGKKGIYQVFPIKGYNLTTYIVNTYLQECTCQAYVKEGRVCSHLIACFLYEKLKLEKTGVNPSLCKVYPKIEEVKIW